MSALPAQKAVAAARPCAPAVSGFQLSLCPLAILGAWNWERKSCLGQQGCKIINWGEGSGIRSVFLYQVLTGWVSEVGALGSLRPQRLGCLVFIRRSV